MAKDSNSQQPMSRGQGQKIINLISRQNKGFDTINEKLDNMQEDIAVIAKNTGHKRDDEGKLYQD